MHLKTLKQLFGPVLLAAVLFTDAAAGDLKYISTDKQKRFIGLKIDVSKAIGQHMGSNYACGPASVLNALVFGNHHLQKVFAQIDGNSHQDKLEHVINKYGKIKSNDYKDRHRWDPRSGFSPVDLTYFAKDILASENRIDIQGRFLDRTEDESTHNHLIRVHGYFVRSLKQGVPVIISLRSFAPDYTSAAKNDIVWNGLANHYVVLTCIPETIGPHEKGFPFEYLDPTGPKRASGYIYIEDRRNFMAAKGNKVSWEWMSDSPFLLVKAPSLNTLDLKTQRWFWRTIVVLNYAIGNLFPS
jgi:hypothetical protein